MRINNKHSAVQNVLQALNSLKSRLFGRTPAMVASRDIGVAGCLVVWYVKDGFRHFVMLRAPKKMGQKMSKARFASFYGLNNGCDAAETLKSAIFMQLGSVFRYSIDEKLLSADRVAAVPSFTYKNEANQDVPVQAMVWTLQVTQDQAQLIQPGLGLRVLDVPEYAMISHSLAPTHRELYKSVARHIHGLGNAMKESEQALEKLEEMLKSDHVTGGKVIH